LISPPLQGSLRRRGAPLGRASEVVSSNNPDFIGVEKKKRKDFDELFTTQMAASVLTETAIRKPEGVSEYDHTIQFFGQ